MKVEIGWDGRTRYNGKTLAEMPFVKSFPLTVVTLEDVELPGLLNEHRYAVKVLLDEIVRRKQKTKNPKQKGRE